MKNQRCDAAGFEDGGGSHKPRKVGLEVINKKINFPLKLPENAQH